MFSRILIKLIDQAIVPAIFLLTVKIVATVGISRYLGIVFTVGPTGFVFDSTADYVRISSYSTFAMVAALAIGLFYILLKSMAFHETHISPKMTAKLFSLRLSTFIQGSFDLYSQGAIWMSYSYLLMFVTGIMSIFGMIYSWVFYSSLILTALSTVFFVLDVENEMKMKDPNIESETEEEIVLSFEEN
ncbi:hypothetical protein A3F07_03020 [candidate division WWE3 bacterium RIFCSPHIGHO2_12_FULL_38_15]|nr:MAG: hypothetical protein A3F07_03020 [candidate division WWE3 bacterium RIFCSPHIGHO2_12_FULL_38_15]OGC52747.1 MAG: hypothetical protein A3B64_01055 [candidate division WWE3 bacterium RIFCSPLOWO2_01_FULL_37_24]HLB52051.1 hypothetical protein [Patescibacteria group bacterium]